MVFLTKSPRENYVCMANCGGEDCKYVLIWDVFVLIWDVLCTHFGRLCPHLGLFMTNDTELFCTITKCLQYGSMMKVFSNGRNTLNQQKY